MITDELLQLFCKRDKGDFRDLNAPYQLGGYLIATDGAVLIRRKCDGEDTKGRGRLPYTEALFRGFDGIKSWSDLPLIDRCEKCEGFGFVIGNCISCYGSGNCTCGCGDEHECAKCDGHGALEVDCDCRKHGDRICGLKISHHYIWLIGQLGDVECGRVNGDKQGLFFRSGEWQGKVCCLEKVR